MTSLTSHKVAGPLALEYSGTVLPERRAHRPAVCGFALLGADCVAMLAAFATVLSIGAVLSGGSGAADVLSARWAALDLAMLSAAIGGYLAVKGRYRERIPFWSDLRLLVSASLFMMAAEAAIGLRTGNVVRSGPVLASLLLFTIYATVANRLVKQALARAGAWTLPVVIVGDGASAAAAERAFDSDLALGYRVVGRIDPSALLSDLAAGLTPPRLRPILGRYGAHRLLIAFETSGELQGRVIAAALRERIPFAVVPPSCAFPAFACDPTRFLGLDAMPLACRDGLSRPGSRIVKATMDVTGALLLLVLAFPVFLAIAVASYLDGGPIMYAHRRVGAGGRPFDCLKFRTMVADADRVLQEALDRDPALAAEWRATRKLCDDPRVTRLGRLLRRTSLDELPQLLNVIRLEMSLVGPRPIVESEIPFYGDDIVRYYATRPGLTGLWQVSGRSNTSYARRVQLDVWYVNNWTIWHDITVLLKTVPVVFGCDGAR